MSSIVWGGNDMANYVTATFTGGETKAVATGLWQWDYGQTLRVEGLNLPRTLEVHFHQRTRQWLMYGVTVDGVMTVSIPNEFLQYAQPVVAYIYLHDAETDGETQYEITLPVVAREKPVNYDDTDPATTAAYQALVDATALLQNDIETVQGYADDASDHATAAEGYAINAEDAAAQAAASASAAGAAVDTAQAAATAAAQSATQAAGSAQTANASAQNADQSAQDAAQSAQEAAQTVQTVEDAAEQVAADKAAVEAAADTFTETTVPAATAAVQQAGSAQISAINTAGTTQTGNVNSAGSTQTAAVNAAGATQIQAITAKGEEYVEEIDTLIEEHIDDTLTQTGMAADAKKTGDEIADLKDAIEQIEAEKADTDGTYPDMTVGMAEQLDSDNYTEDSEPYHFRKSGGGVRVGDREIDKIVGGTVAWNQLQTGFLSRGAVQGIVRTASEDGTKLTYTGTSTVEDNYTASTVSYLPPGHKIFVTLGDVSLPTGARILGSNVDKSTQSILIASEAKTIQISIRINAGVTVDFTITPMAIDLTQMFGSTIADYIYQLETATAGAGVAFLRRYIDIDTYHPYDAGTLKSVEGLVSHDMVGFNQWDEVAEVGRIDINTGNNISGNGIRSEHLIEVIPSTTYHAVSGSYTGAASIIIFYYDADGNYITYANRIGMDVEFTVPSNAKYIKFNIQTSTAVTYNHDICINLSDPAKNGTYEPYEKHSYPLDSTVTLRGVPKLVDGKLVYDGDRYASDGTVTRRYGIVDLGALSWVTNGEDSVFADVPLKKVGSRSVICDKLMYSIAQTISSVPYNGFRTYDASNGIAVKISGITPSNATTMLSGMMLVYELATPTTETAAPFTSPQWVDGTGTEQYVSTSLVPIGHYTQYPEDLKAKIEGLPWDFASLIAPTEATYKATQNYTSGSLLIVNNILYKTTAAIANGGNITPGTNCTATTLAAVIAAL